MTDQPFEYVDRYTALGITPPPVNEVCPGPCEGTGIYPCHIEGAHAVERAEIDRRIAEGKQQADGWYFLTCATCGGTGRRP